MWPVKHSFSAYYSLKGPENINLAGHQNQVTKRCPLGDTHTNRVTRQMHKLLLKRYVGAGVRLRESAKIVPTGLHFWRVFQEVSRCVLN